MNIPKDPWGLEVDSTSVISYNNNTDQFEIIAKCERADIAQLIICTPRLAMVLKELYDEVMKIEAPDTAMINARYRAHLILNTIEII